MPTLEHRVLCLEDERDIRQTMYRYGYAIDYGTDAEWIDCWCDDATLHWDKPYQGHDEIRAVFRLHTHAPDIYHKHLLLNVRISLLGDTASGESMFARVDAYPDGPRILAFGRYLDRFARCADGRWRFKERRAEVEAMASPPQAVQDFLAKQQAGE